MPDHPVVIALLEHLGMPLLNVTARDSLGSYLGDPHDIERMLGKQLGAVIDGGIIPENPSTVIDMTSENAEVLRVGQGDPDAFL